MRATLLAASLLILACRNEVFTPPAGDAGAFWALSLDHRAVALSMLSPHNTLQLTAVPRTSTGERIAGLGAPTFISASPVAVHVSTTGLLTARVPTVGVFVIASLTAQGITYADTALVTVMDGPAPEVASLSIHPVPPDSAKFALRGTLTETSRSLVPRVLDAGGAELTGIPVHFLSLHPTVARLDAWGGSIIADRIGPADFVATTTAYGRVLADTLRFTIGLPAYVEVFILSAPRTTGGVPERVEPVTVTVGAGAVVLWDNSTSLTPTGIVFDDPSHVAAVPEWENCVFFGAPCEAGDVAPFVTNGDGFDFEDFNRNRARVRRFPVPGTYHYTIPGLDIDGTVVVVDESP